MKHIRAQSLIVGSLLCTGLNACAPANEVKSFPALEYARTLGAGQRQDVRRAQALSGGAVVGPPAASHVARHQAAQVTTVSNQVGSEARFRYAADKQTDQPTVANESGVVTNLLPESDRANDAGFEVHHNATPNIRDYNGPLSLGDPGVSASLWQESRGETNLFHDFRAWQPMDLITIVVTERSEGLKMADTDLKTESSFQAAVENFLGYENDVIEHNSDSEGKPKIDLSNLVKASTDTEFKGTGRTGRTDTLKAQISAMVVEVLPGGLLRIEGERIISMNNEEQIMVISGLARTRDLNSENQIDSAKIANLRIDYFGRGTVSSAQVGGWLGNVLRYLWPF